MSRWNAAALCVALLLSHTAEAQTMTDTQSSQPSCDLAALRDYPMSRVQRLRAIGISNPYLSFRDLKAHPRAPDDHMRKPSVAEIRAALARGLDTFDPVEHRVLMLAAIADWIPGENGIVSFFVLDHAVLLDDVLAVMDAEGLAEHAAILREAATAFGPVDIPSSERFARIHGPNGGGKETELKKHLSEFSRQFKALPSPLDIAAERITASPELMAIYEALRKDTADEERIDWLAGKLWSCLDHYGPPDEVARRLAELPDPYDRIIVTYLFQAEMLNGGVHQFFSNSSGVLAPDVAEALDSMNLPQHAQTVRKGMALFPDPYPRDRQIRLNFMAGQDEDFDNSLHDLTYEVDDGEMSRAMIRIAREADVLPR